MPRCLHTLFLLLTYLLGPVALFAAPPDLDLDLPTDFVTKHQARIEALCDALDLNRPGLEAVAEAYAKGNIETAAEALLVYYRDLQRTSPLPMSVDLPPEPLDAADALQRDIFRFQKVEGSQPRLPSGHLNWNAQGPRNDPEWAWMLNRHAYFATLIYAWQQTGDDSYLFTLSSHLIDWVESNPYPDRLTFSASWRALEAARRLLDSWTYTFFTLQDQPGFTAEARLLMLTSLPEHADNLRNHASFWGGNHLLTEKTALVALSVAWPEFRDSEDWLDYAVGKTREELLAQTYPDGAFKELTNHYQRVVLLNLQIFVNLLMQSEQVKPDAILLGRAQAMWDFFVGSMRPNGYGPLNSASDIENNAHTVWESNVVDFYDREDWRYIDTFGKEGQRPADPPTRFYPWAGHAIMRSDWDTQADWAFFDIGPHGTAHQHLDRLHLSLSVGGVDFLVDSGRYTYQPGAWREYFKGPRGHNVLILDNQAAVPPPLEVSKPLPVAAQIHPEWDFFAASERFPADVMSGRNGAHHTRVVLFDKANRRWFVIDEVIDFTSAKAEFLWHFHPEVSLHPRENGTWIATRDNVDLQIALLTANTELVLDPTGSSYSERFNIKESAPLLSTDCLLTGPQIFVWCFQEGTDGVMPEIVIKGREVSIAGYRIDLKTSQAERILAE